MSGSESVAIDSDGIPYVNLGSAILTEGVYSYPDAVGGGSQIRTLIFDFSKTVIEGDGILLLTIHDGFNVSEKSLTK